MVFNLKRRRKSMKKVWLIVLIFFSMALLAGCQEVELSEPVISDPTTVVPTEIVEEDTFLVEVVNLSGDVLASQSIVYDAEDEKTVAELIDQHMGLDYMVYDIGWFVQGVADIYPTEFGVTYNYWFSIYVNDELSFIGIEEIIYEENLTITFKESTMLDATELEVDRVIQDFLTHHFDTYVNDDVVHYGVYAALKQLKTRGYHNLDLSSTVTLSKDTIGNLYKAAVIEMVKEVDTANTLALLEEASTTNVYEAISLLYGLIMLGGSESQINDLVDLIITTENSYMDADYAGMVISVLSYVKDYEGVAEFTQDMITYIQSELSHEGVTSWGSANAASTAQVILGLVAQGISPRSETYTTEDVDLVEALLLYEMQGAFKYQLTQSANDMSFSTPQAFQALVAYKIYRDTWGNPPFELHRLGA